MDDKTFDRKTALDWIATIEGTPKSLRDDDIYPKLRDWVERIAPTSILDIGCGQGICSEKIILENRFYTGIDPSSFLIERATSLYKNKNRNFIMGNIYNLPFSDENFDAIFSILVWHLLKDIEKATNQLSRILKQSGHFLIITANPNAYSEWIRFYSDAKVSNKILEGTMIMKDGIPSKDTLYLHELEDISNALNKSNLAIHGIEEFRPSKNSADKNMLIAIYGQKI